jgi:hypothetical protein
MLSKIKTYTKVYLVLSFFINANLIAVSHNENIAPSTNKPKSFYKKSDSLSVDKNLKSNKNNKNKSFLKKYHKPLIIGLTITTVVSLAALTYYVIKEPAIGKITSLTKSLSPQNQKKLYDFFSLGCVTPITVSSVKEQQKLQTILKQVETHNKQYGNIKAPMTHTKYFSGFTRALLVAQVYRSIGIQDAILYEYENNDIIVENPL